MKYQALISFTGIIAMAKGDIREISDVSIASSLLKAGYIVEAEEVEEKPEAKPPVKRKGKKKNVD